MNIYDYQQKAYEDAGVKDAIIPFDIHFRCLKKANDMHLQDIIEELRQGHDVIAEQTFYRAKRRIAYIDEIRRALNVEIEVYVMHPSDERWRENIRMRELSGDLNDIKREAEDIEFPNPIEGFDRIYEVIDDDIKLKMDDPEPKRIEKARKELQEEADRIRT